MNDLNMKKYPAFSLLEILLALTIFVFIIGSVSIFSIDAVMYAKNEQRLVSANNQMTQLLSAVVDFKNLSWSEFSAEADGTDKYFTRSGAVFSITDGTQVVDGVTRYFSANPVYRDDTGNIVTTGGVLDPFTIKVTATVEWTDLWGDAKSSSISTYVNKWDIQRWRNNTQEQFDVGTYWQTESTLDNDGEVKLELLVDLLPNWCNPALSATYHDIPGNGIASTVIAYGDKAFLGTGANASGTAFTKVDIDTTETEPVINVLGSWDNGKVNMLFNDGDYTYMASDTNSQEVRILDHSDTPYSVVGYVDAPGSTDGMAIYKIGNVGLLGQGRVLVVFDASSPIGSRSVLDTITLGRSSSSITTLVAIGDFVYVGMQSDTYEVYEVNISDPNDVIQTGRLSVNSMNTTDLYVTEDQTRLFLLTTHNGSEDELFLVNLTNRLNKAPIINSLNLDTMSTTSAAIVEEDMIMIIAGSSLGGQDNYRVFQYNDEQNIVDCGGLYVEDPISDIDATTIYDPVWDKTNYYTYALTSDNSKEFQIVRGDEGELGGLGFGYRSNGTYESLIYDSVALSPDYLYFNWIEVLPEGTDIQLQIRSASSEAAVAEATWVGPDGTAGTYYTDPSYAEIPTLHDGNRYIQFIAYLSTENPDYTPELHKIDIFYEE